jgi:hypothetical protein
VPDEVLTLSFQTAFVVDEVSNIIKEVSWVFFALNHNFVEFAVPVMDFVAYNS